MRHTPEVARSTWRMMAAAVFALCACMASAAQQKPLALVSTAWPPFTNVPGQPRFALDLVEAALGRIGVAVETTIVAAAEFTPALVSGPFDGSAAVWKDAERERSLIFSDPYLENRLVLVGRSGTDVSARTIADLRGKRVAIVEGYSYGEELNDSAITFLRARSEEDSLTRLLHGDVDYTLMDDLVVQYLVGQYPKESAARLQIALAPLITRPLHFAVRRTLPDAEGLVSRFNAQLRGMILDHTYHRLLHVDWIRADVNGDGRQEYVPSEDKAGPAAPQRAYMLFSRPETLSKTTEAPGFYIGGSLYEDWASVPESYKDVNPRYPDPRRSSASIFKFTW